MAVTNVACPHCGQETLVTIPSDGKLNGVAKRDGNRPVYGSSGKSEASCSECGGTFWAGYEH